MPWGTASIFCWIPLAGANGQTMRWQAHVRSLKRDLVAIALAVRDPRVPWYAKLVAACVVAYALSPIDLIPDFVPVLGYLDDLVLVPLGLMLVVRLIPTHVLAEHRAAASATAERPVSRAGALAVIGVWMLAALLLASWLGKGLGPWATGAFGINYSGRPHYHDQHHL
jgi:uncharacterized membrane protein YkvA (DUF1232 family)